jgi:hypothetical protein
MSRTDIEKVKQKLRLEGDIEKKLNKLIKRQSWKFIRYDLD